MIARLVAVGIGVLGLVVAFLWQRRPLRDVGRDVGLHLIEQAPAETDEELEALYRLPAAERDGAE